MPLLAGGWGAALSGAIKGAANQRLKEIELQEQFEREKQLMLYRQELEYRRELRLQEEYQRKTERELKMQQEAQIRKEQKEKSEREKLALDEKSRIEADEIEHITTLIGQVDSDSSSKAENLISKSIPKWKEIVQSEAFSNWFYQQPDQVQLLADSTSHKDAIKLITLYKNKK